MEMKTRIREKFKTLFGVEGEVFASAGRVNLIGEHTDYNGGYVFPGAINCGIMTEIKVNGTAKVKAFSLDYDEYVEFGLTEEDKPQQQWARYIFGVCRETIKRGGKVEGFDCVFAGDVPLGAGLSSSAALESTFAFAINELFDNKIDPCGLGVVVDEVDLSEVEAFHNFLLRSVIVAEHPGVHQQSTACRRIEPSQIEDRLGLTSSHKVPFTVGPSLDPGVVVVRMGPAGSVDLPCWNAN